MKEDKLNGKTHVLREVSVVGQCRKHGKGRSGIAIGTPKYNIEGIMERVKKAKRSWLFFIIFPH